MLVLSRKRDERLMIGDEIIVSILEVRGDKVRLGIEAPADVEVYREEIWLAIQKERREAAAAPPPPTATDSSAA